MDKIDISNVSKICKSQHELHQLERTLMGGTKAIRSAGKTFTPQYPKEDDDAYKARINGAFLFNGFESTLKKMVGKVMSKNIIEGEDIPTQIKEYLPNVDGQGRNLTAFALDLLKEALVDGVSYIFVDFPKIIPIVEGQKPLLSDQKAQGARPTSMIYVSDQIIGFSHSNINGAEVLTQVRIKEVVTQKTGAYDESEVTQIRVLNIGSFEIWRMDSDNKNWVLFDSGITSLNFIPLIPVYTNRIGYMLGSPPLKSLAELNLEHWISSTDQRKALVFARFAMMVFSGVKPGSIKEVGPDMVIELMEPNATWGKIESSGDGIVAGRLDLEAIENKMEHAGMIIQIQNASGDITATAASINSDEANAALLAAAGSLEDSLNQMLDVFAKYEGLTEGGTVSVNKAFGRRRSTATVSDLINLYNSGLIDNATLLQELQVRGDISPDLNINDVLQKLSINPPVLLGGGNQ